MSDPQLEDVVTHKELAEFLGISEVSLSLYRLPRVDLGRHKLYFKQTVVDWLRARETTRPPRQNKK